MNDSQAQSGSPLPSADEDEYEHLSLNTSILLILLIHCRLVNFENLLSAMREKSESKKRRITLDVLAEYGRSSTTICASMTRVLEDVEERLIQRHEALQARTAVLSAEREKVQEEVIALVNNLQARIDEAERTRRHVIQAVHAASSGPLLHQDA